MTDILVLLAAGWAVRDRFLAGARHFSLFFSVQTASEAHPAFYAIGYWGSFPGSKATGA
jgi:hypothetical protein